MQKSQICDFTLSTSTDMLEKIENRPDGNYMKIRHIETNELMSPGQLIKTLIKRSGLSRNEVHEEMKKRIVGRSIGPASRLSDICADRRKLPMRDLVPLFDSIPMKEADKHQYLTELINAYTEGNIHRYIASPTKSRIQKYKQEQLLDSLNKEIVKINEIIYRNNLKEIKTKHEKNLVELFGLNEPYIYDIEEKQDEYYLSECEFGKYRNRLILAVSEIDLAFKDKTLFRVVSSCLSKNVVNDIMRFGDESYFYDSPISSGDLNFSNWDWLSKVVKKLTIYEVNCNLFNIWKDLYPDALELSIKEIDRLTVRTPFWKHEHGFPSLFEFLSEHHSLMKRACPYLYNLLNPMAIVYGDSFISGDSLTSEILEIQCPILKDYIGYIESGWSDYLTFGDYSGNGVAMGNSNKTIEDIIMAVAINFAEFGVILHDEIELVRASSKLDESIDAFILGRARGSLSHQYELFSKSQIDALKHFYSLLSGGESLFERIAIFQWSIRSMVADGLNENSVKDFTRADLEFKELNSYFSIKYQKLVARLESQPDFLALALDSVTGLNAEPKANFKSDHDVTYKYSEHPLKRFI